MRQAEREVHLGLGFDLCQHDTFQTLDLRVQTTQNAEKVMQFADSLSVSEVLVLPQRREVCS